MQKLLTMGIGMAVFLLVIAYVVPIGMTAFTGASTTGWTAQQTQVWNALPTLTFVGLLLAVVFVAIKVGSDRTRSKKKA